MARTNFDGFEATSTGSSDAHSMTIDIHGESSLQLPADLDFASADIVRDGQDLILRDADGTEVVINNYFNADPAPSLLSESGGQSLSPQLVQAFVQHDGAIRMANAGTSMSDASPVGEVTEVTGEAKIIRNDGTEEKLTLGTPVFEGDIIETEGSGAVNIGFIDDSSFAVSENARIAIDEFVFDPSTEAGAQDFSILRGVFMYTSGLIGRENPDSVDIDTPVGSIGIRGTIIGGKIDPGGESQITVIEGAIVVRNGGGEQLLSTQFETVKLSGFNAPMSHIGALDVQEVANDYGAVKNVSANLFSSFNDQMQENGPSSGLDESSTGEEAPAAQEDAGGEAEEQILENPIETAPEQEPGAQLKSVMESKKELASSLQDVREALQEKLAEANDTSRTETETQPKELLVRLNPIDTVTMQFVSGGSIAENATGGDIVGRVGPTSSLPFNVTYSLLYDGGGRFAIDAQTGDISVISGAGLNFEDQAFHYLKIQVTRTDTGGSRDFGMRVGVGDINELAQVNFALGDIYDVTGDLTGVVGLNDPGAIVGRIEISDPEMRSFTTADFNLTGSQSGYFEIVDLEDGFYLKLKDHYEFRDNAGSTQLYDTDAASNVTFYVSPWNVGIDLNDAGAGLDNLSLKVAVSETPITQATDSITETVSGIGEIIFGTEGTDLFNVSTTDFKLIRGDGDYDTVRLQFSAAETADAEYTLIDLSSTESNLLANSADLKGIEEIVIAGRLDTLQMNIEDILDLLKTSETGRVKITSHETEATDKNDVMFKLGGSVTDLVDADTDGDSQSGDFVKFNQTAADTNGNTYHVFQHDLGQVLLDVNLVNGADGGAPL